MKLYSEKFTNLAILLCFLSTPQDIWGQGRYELPQPHNHARSENNLRSELPVSLGGLAPLLKENAEGCYESNAGNGQDLAIQWEAVRAAQESAKAAWWSWYVGAIGLILLFITLIATGYAAWFARITAKGLIQSERPHVRLFTTIKKRSRSGNLIEVMGVTFKNYGRTPAIIDKLCLEYVVLAGGPPHPDSCSYCRFYTDGSIIAENETWPYKGFVHQMNSSLPNIEVLRAEQQRTGGRLFVYGRIFYKDAFNQNLYTNFCRELDDRGNFTFNNGDIDSDKTLNKAI